MDAKNCLVMIGGLAGVGKTTLARKLAQRTGFALVDKDTVVGRLVDALMVAKGSPLGSRDRHSSIYLNEVRGIEYAALLDVVLENLGVGVSVIAVAPFSREMADPAWRQEWGEAAGVPVQYVWVSADERTVREQLIRRGSPRDEYKLAHWNEYWNSVRAVCPCEPYLEVTSDGCSGVMAAFRLAER